MTAHHERPLPRPDAPDAVTVPRVDDGPSRWDEVADRLGRPSVRTLALGFAGSVLMLIGGFGSGGTLLRDPILGNSAFSFWRYGHGEQLAGMLIYAGLIVMVWAWVRLGRDVLARRVSGRGVLVTALAWIVPLLVS